MSALQTMAEPAVPGSSPKCAACVHTDHCCHTRLQIKGETSNQEQHLKAKQHDLADAKKALEPLQV